MLSVFQNKVTKSDSRHSCLGKKLTHWRKREQNESTKEKLKCEMEQISGQEKNRDGLESE